MTIRYCLSLMTIFALFNIFVNPNKVFVESDELSCFLRRLAEFKQRIPHILPAIFNQVMKIIIDDTG